MSNNFINAPNWKKVEEYTVKILEMFETDDMTYLDKDNVLSIVRSAIVREFNLLGVMSYIATITEKQQVQEKKKLDQLYS